MDPYEPLDKPKQNIRRLLTAPVILALVVAITIIAHIKTLHNGFVGLDDDRCVVTNGDIRALSLKNIARIVTTSNVNMYQPLTTLTFAIDYRMGGLNPAIFHFTNLLLHVLNTVLVYHFVQKLHQRLWLAVFVAFFFGLHPMHVESVAWVSSRKDLLYSAFYLAALVSYLQYIRMGTPGRRCLLLALLLMIGSVMAKSAGVTLPIALIILDVFMRRPIGWQIVWEKMPFLLISLVFGLISLHSQDVTVNGAGMLEGFGLRERFELSCYAISFYVVKLFAPLDLSAINPFPLHVGAYLPFPYRVAPWFLAGLALVLARLNDRRREVWFGVGFFMINILLVVHIIPVGYAVTADRYSYLSYVGLLLAVGWGGIAISDRVRGKIAWLPVGMPLVAIACGVACFLATSSRIEVWRDTVTLFSDVIKKRGKVPIALVNRSNAYAYRGDYTSALADLDELVAATPLPVAFLNRGQIKYLKGDIDGAVADLQRVALLSPGSYQAYERLGAIYLALNRKEEARRYFEIGRKLRREQWRSRQLYESRDNTN